MRLIDREQRQLQARQAIDGAIAEETFGRDVEQVELLLDQVAGMVAAGYMEKMKAEE